MEKVAWETGPETKLIQDNSLLHVLAQTRKSEYPLTGVNKFEN